MIIVRNLTKEIVNGPTVLHRMSFQVDQGDLVALVGASGSGKTTLFRCLMLKERWTDGQYIYNGKDISKIRGLEKFKISKDWAYLEENPQFNLNQTAVKKNVLSSRWRHLPLWRTLTRSASMDEHVGAMDYLEKKVGLLDKADMPVSKLSGGEKQRVAIARA